MVNLQAYVAQKYDYECGHCKAGNICCFNSERYIS